MHIFPSFRFGLIFLENNALITNGYKRATFRLHCTAQSKVDHEINSGVKEHVNAS